MKPAVSVSGAREGGGRPRACARAHVHVLPPRGPTNNNDNDNTTNNNNNNINNNNDNQIISVTERMRESPARPGRAPVVEVVDDVVRLEHFYLARVRGIAVNHRARAMRGVRPSKRREGDIKDSRKRILTWKDRPRHVDKIGTEGHAT